MKRLRRLHGMHWRIVSHLGMRLVRSMEMGLMMVLLCHSTRVRPMDVLVEDFDRKEGTSSLFLWVVRIGVVSAIG
jgi:hypothetical protein